MTTPHGIKLRAELFVVPAPLFHPQNPNLYTSGHYWLQMVTAAATQTFLLLEMDPYS